jgi:trimeric autotransporter adhesin
MAGSARAKVDAEANGIQLKIGDEGTVGGGRSTEAGERGHGGMSDAECSINVPRTDTGDGSGSKCRGDVGARVGNGNTCRGDVGARVGIGSTCRGDEGARVGSESTCRGDEGAQFGRESICQGDDSAQNGSGNVCRGDEGARIGNEGNSCRGDKGASIGSETAHRGKAAGGGKSGDKGF